LIVVRKIGSQLIIINRLIEIPCLNKVVISYRMDKIDTDVMSAYRYDTALSLSTSLETSQKENKLREFLQ